ncbi:MAG: hypothetical protein R6X25_10950 [Candidatus Krumholzibacteriia bacterium]
MQPTAAQRQPQFPHFSRRRRRLRRWRPSAVHLVLVRLAAVIALGVPGASTAAREPEAASPAIAGAPDEAAPPGSGIRDYYFYEGRRYGSESLITPPRLIINGGFGILQMENRSNRISDIDFERGWRGLWNNLGNPVAAIDHVGWWDFLHSELIPVSINSGKAQYWPNYMNHLIGGGMSYRMMREWFTWHRYPWPTAWALTTIWSYHLLNETVEMDGRTGWRADPVADVYIFDIAGILLFSSDRVARFFGQTLNMADWSWQPFYDPELGTLENAGQNYMVRLRLQNASPWYIFYHWGNSGEFGLSRHLGDGYHLSAGGGFVAKNLRDVDRFSETANLTTSGGLFLDCEGSLLASVLYAKNKDNRWRVNLYPGVFRVGPLQPGLAAIVTQQRRVMFGVTIGILPLPVGVGARVGRS